jgi:transposase, IS5 family
MVFGRTMHPIPPRKETPPMLTGLFDVEFRLQELDKGGDPLLKLNQTIDWEIFRPALETIRDKQRKSAAGRPPLDAVLMFKILVLQSLYNLSDDATEYQIRDRLSFTRFLGLTLGDRVPDAKTIWLFREQLGEAQLIETLFARFDEHLNAHGFAARKGQIIDASIVAAPRQRNTREENAQIKQGRTPEAWAENPAKLRQKDTDARWTKKNSLTYYGYKNHLCVDAKHKLIRQWAVTDAAVHDSQIFEELLDEDNTRGEVWADSAYRSPENLKTLEEWGLRERVQRKGVRGRPLSQRQQQGNRTRSKIRSRVEHVFGVQAMRAGLLLLRSIGIWRARAKIGLRNLAYNLDRFGHLATAKG